MHIEGSLIPTIGQQLDYMLASNFMHRPVPEITPSLGSTFPGQGLQGGNSEMMILKEEIRCLKDEVVDGVKSQIQFLKNEKLVVDGRLLAVEMEVDTLRERLAAVESKSGDELVSSISCSVVKEVVGQLRVFVAPLLEKSLEKHIDPIKSSFDSAVKQLRAELLTPGKPNCIQTPTTNCSGQEQPPLLRVRQQEQKCAARGGVSVHCQIGQRILCCCTLQLLFYQHPTDLVGVACRAHTSPKPRAYTGGYFNDSVHVVGTGAGRLSSTRVRRLVRLGNGLRGCASGLGLRVIRPDRGHALS